MKIKLLPTDYNPVYHQYLHSINRPIEILFGSGGSGKSVAAALKCLLRVLGGHNCLVVRQRANSLRSSFFAELKSAAESIGISNYFKFYKGDLTIDCSLNGKQILFRGLDDPGKLVSIRPVNGVIDHVYWEEAGESRTIDALYQLQIRQRGGGDMLTTEELEEMRRCIESDAEWKKLKEVSDEVASSGKTLTLMFNPVYEGHWLNKTVFKHYGIPDDIFERKAYLTKDVYCLHTTHWDNRFLTYEDHAKYEATKHTSPYYYQVYALGRWGVLGDTCLKDWYVADLSGVTSTEYCYGLDFGVKDPTMLIKSAIDHNKRRIYVFGEWGSPEMKQDDVLHMLHANAQGGVVYCDHNERMTFNYLSTKLQDKGVILRRAIKPEIVAGIRFLQSYTIIIDKNCPKIINEISTGVWLKDARGETLPKIDEKSGGGWHCLDALRYSLSEYMNEKKLSKAL